ncbi:hypothetical protein J437_LFUL019614 [Ladona fulva]|nr:hypothetical protein J437_LFUL019614 [Ladona fulva]
MVGGILGYVYREKARHAMEQEMQSTIRQYGYDANIRQAWDDTQENKFPCQSAPNALTIYTDGCLNKTEQFVKDHAAIIGGAGIGVACIMLLGMIFSCALFKMIE